jgi:hypothetical protein
MSTSPADKKQSLSSLTTTTTVENVVIFVSDALRFDSIPKEIKNLGVTAKAIAPSTFTANALPSITSGQYPATHKVWRFQDDQLASEPVLFDSHDYDVGFNAKTVWLMDEAAKKPPLRWNHQTKERTIQELDPPFVHFIHDVGPHAPYGYDNTVWDSSQEFFRTYSETETLRKLYAEDCDNSADRFLSVLEYLRNEDLLDETLVIYTSDHGQCLGEEHNGGQFGHVDPMCPEIVYIPITFLGARLPKGQDYDGLLSGVDIAPTALAAQNRLIPQDMDGQQVWTTTPADDRTARCDVWAHENITFAGRTVTLNAYAATGLWDQYGGQVRQRRPRIQRFGYVADKLLRGTQSPVWLPNVSFGTIAGLLSTYGRNEITYGAPRFSMSTAERSFPDRFTEAIDREAASDCDELEEKLAALGYFA